jgi:polyhydroxybutyrate depolymerase
MLRFAFVFFVLASMAGAQTAPACGTGGDCLVDDGRSYRIRMPETGAGETVGAIFFAHGFRGSAAGVMRNKSLGRMADRLGVALIALDAGGEDWALPGAPHPGEGRDELTYVDNVIADASARFAIDKDRLVASGFSAGAMLVWTLACARGDRFAGFVPIAGTFWAPVPESCPGPVSSVIHIHGDADKTVPLLGRAIGNARQGAVPDALAMYARLGEFGPVRQEYIGDLGCDTRRNATGEILMFCQFSGGHSFRTEFLSQAWDMLAKAGRL